MAVQRTRSFTFNCFIAICLIWIISSYSIYTFVANAFTANPASIVLTKASHDNDDTTGNLASESQILSIDYSHHRRWNEWYFNFTAIASFNPQATASGATHKRETDYIPNWQLFRRDISHIISWQPDRYRPYTSNAKTGSGYCGPQHFADTFQYKTNIQPIATIPYLEVHDVVLETSGAIIWIYAINPTHKINQSIAYRDNKEAYEGVFRLTVSVQQFVVCAYNDGTTVVSHRIVRASTFPAWNVIIRCDVPLHLRAVVRSPSTTATTTNVTVSLLNVRHLPFAYGGIEMEVIDKRTRFANLNTDIASAILTALPVCAVFEINSFPLHQPQQRKTQDAQLWRFEAVSELVDAPFVGREDDSMEAPHYAPLKRTQFSRYTYNISACVLMYAPQLDHNIDYAFRFDQIEKWIHDWLEYNTAMLGVEHFIVYEHRPSTQRLQHVQQKYDRKYRGDDEHEHQPINVSRVVFDVLAPYIARGLVTYIAWPKPFQIPWTFQMSQMHSCVKRFGHTGHSEYLVMMDLDEYIVPTREHEFAQQEHTLLELIRMTVANETDEAVPARERSQSDRLQRQQQLQKQNKYNRHKFGPHRRTENVRYFKNAAFELFCYKAFTCKQEWGCLSPSSSSLQQHPHQGFDSVLARHRCVSHDIDTLSYRKVIVRAAEVEYMFVHFVDKFRDGTSNEYYNPFTRRLKNALCVHTKSQLPKHWAMQQNSDLNAMIDQFHRHLARTPLNETIVGSEKRVLPLFENNATFCI